MTVQILTGDCRELLPALADASVHCIVTSPPYFGLRDYGEPGQLGQEDTLAGYLDAIVAVFAALRRVLRRDGVAFLNIGDAYAGSWGAVSKRRSEAAKVATRSTTTRSGRAAWPRCAISASRPAT